MDSKINEMINQFSENGVYHRTHPLHEIKTGINYVEALPIMVKMGIITKIDNIKNIYELTDFGFKIRRSGGWIEYNKQLEIDKKRERDNIQASINTNNTLNRTIWLTIGIGAVAALGTLGQWLFPLKESMKTESRYQMKTEHHHYCFCHNSHCIKHAHATNDTTHETTLKTDSFYK